MNRDAKVFFKKSSIKVSSCLELVRTGKIDPKDAREAFKLWGVDDDEMIEKTLNFIAKLAEHQVGKKKSNDSNETDNPELCIIMSLLKGLGLQIPHPNESSTEDIEQILTKMFTDGIENPTTMIGEDTHDEKLEFHELLALFEGNETEMSGTRKILKGQRKLLRCLSIMIRLPRRNFLHHYSKLLRNQRTHKASLAIHLRNVRDLWLE